MENTTEDTLFQIQQALANASGQLAMAQQLMSGLTGEAVAPHLKQRTQQVNQADVEAGNQIVEGVFNGQNMVGPDGKIYTIPANYVSKSKLVEGDLLKLTILPDGSFMYKQIGPIERSRLVGTLVLSPDTGDYTVAVGQKHYRVIKASITYYKGMPGDEVVILTPQDAESSWAAVENVIHQGSLSTTVSDMFATPELPLGDQAELPSGSAAELPSGSEAELASGSAAEIGQSTTQV